jgi:hypothetical protein
MNERSEYRPVFRHPQRYGLAGGLYQPPDSYGHAVDTLDEAQRQHPVRGEETPAWRVGIETRTVTDWTPVQ